MGTLSDIASARRQKTPASAKRASLSLNQLRSCLYLRSDGIVVPGTALTSEKNYSTYLRFCSEMIAERSTR